MDHEKDEGLLEAEQKLSNAMAKASPQDVKARIRVSVSVPDSPSLSIGQGANAFAACISFHNHFTGRLIFRLWRKLSVVVSAAPMSLICCWRTIGCVMPLVWARLGEWRLRQMSLLALVLWAFVVN